MVIVCLDIFSPFLFRFIRKSRICSTRFFRLGSIRSVSKSCRRCRLEWKCFFLVNFSAKEGNLHILWWNHTGNLDSFSSHRIWWLSSPSSFRYFWIFSVIFDILQLFSPYLHLKWSLFFSQCSHRKRLSSHWLFRYFWASKVTLGWQLSWDFFRCVHAFFYADYSI